MRVNGIYLPYNPPRNPSLNNYNDTHNNIILLSYTVYYNACSLIYVHPF